MDDIVKNSKKCFKCQLEDDEKLMYLIKLGYDFDDAEDQIYD